MSIFQGRMHAGGTRAQVRTPYVRGLGSKVSHSDIEAQRQRKEQGGPPTSRINWLILAASGGAIAAAFSGLFGAPENAKIALSVGVAIVLPLVSWWLHGRHEGQHHGSQ